MNDVFETIGRKLLLLGIESKKSSNGELMITYCGLKMVFREMTIDCNSYRIDVKIDADFEQYNRRQLLEMANQLNHESDAWKLFVDKKGIVSAYYVLGWGEMTGLLSKCCSMFLYYLHLLIKSIMIPLDNYDGGLILMPIDVKRYDNYFINLGEIYEILEDSYDTIENYIVDDEALELHETLNDGYRLLAQKIAKHTGNILTYKQ